MSKILFPGGGSGPVTEVVETFSAVTDNNFYWFGVHPSGESGVVWAASPPNDGDVVTFAYSDDNFTTSGTSTDSGANLLLNSRSARGSVDLAPTTLYQYRLIHNGALTTSGSFTSPTPSGTTNSFSIAFGSCQSGFIDAPVIFHSIGEGIIRETPRIFIHLGDLGYADIPNREVQFIDKRQVFDPTRSWVSGVIRKMMFAPIWSDHDYSENNQDGNIIGKELASSGFKNTYPTNEFVDSSGALYREFTMGDAHIIILDERYWRDRNATNATVFPTNYPDAASGATSTTIDIDPSGSPSAVTGFYNRWYVEVSGIRSRVDDYDPSTNRLTLKRPIADLHPGALYKLTNKSMLDGVNFNKNENQTDWLIDKLRSSEARWKIIAGGLPFNRTINGDIDKWGFYDTHDAELFYIAQQTSGVVENIVSIAGDLHFGAIDAGIFSSWPEIISGPLQETPRADAGSWSVGTTVPSGIRNFGLLKFESDTSGNRRVVASIVEPSGSTALQLNIPEWQPNDLANGTLALWLKPDNIQVASLGTSGVGSWANDARCHVSSDSDGSPSGVQQTNSSERPFVISGAINGYDVVHFKGGDGYHLQQVSNEVGQWFDQEDEPLSAFAVMRVNEDDGGSQAVWGLGRSSDALMALSQEIHWGLGNPGQYRFFRRDAAGTNVDIRSNTPLDPAPPLGEWFIYSYSYDGTTLNNMWNNGSGILTGPSGANVGANLWNTFTVGAYERNDGNPINWFNGDLAELIIVNSGINNADTQKIHRYLARKYNITLASGSSVATEF